MLALFSFDFAPLDGGIARLCTQLHVSLQDRGCGVVAITGAADVPDRPGIVRLRGKRPWLDGRALLELRALRPMAVVCGRWYPEGLLALLAGCRVVLLAHGAELLPLRRSRELLGWGQLRRRVLLASRLVLANSAYTRKLVLRLAPRARVSAVPLGVDATYFCPGSSTAARQLLGIKTRHVVSTVSRVQAFKGHETVLRGMALLPREVQEQLTYVVAGRGPHAAELQRLAATLGVAPRLLMAGLVPDERLREIYRASDLFCLLTRETASAVEGFGLALLEAQSCGVPVLGTRTGGIPDALADGETGWLVEENQPVAVAEHLRRLVEDPSEYRRAGVAARRRALDQCSWEHYAGRVLEELTVSGII